MRFDTIIKKLEKGNSPKIYVINDYIPFIITGYVKRVIIELGEVKEVDLEPYVSLELITDSYRNGLCGKVQPDTKITCYEELLIKPERLPCRIMVTSSHKEHEKQASKIVKDLLISGLKTPRFKKYLTLAERL